MKLYMDPLAYDFKKKNPEEWATFGCGPGGFGDYLVPDTMWGLDISESCRIHDWYYRFYSDRSEAAREWADICLRENSLLIVRTHSTNWFTKTFRAIRCKTYYKMVRRFGESSWNDVKGIRDK
jgi:hypothetical protein